MEGSNQKSSFSCGPVKITYMNLVISKQLFYNKSCQNQQKKIVKQVRKIFYNSSKNVFQVIINKKQNTSDRQLHVRGSLNKKAQKTPFLPQNFSIPTRKNNLETHDKIKF